MGNKLYFECASGIAGDMAVAAMLDLGASEEGLFRTLRQLDLEGYKASTEIFYNSSIKTKRFSVALSDPSHPDVPGADNFDPRDDMESNTLSSPEKPISAHENDDSVSHEHTHFHRNLDDITVILHRLEDYRVCDLALRIFRIVAEAEASVHGEPIDQVHFHEVGSVDSIVDIVSAAYCFVDLGIEEVLLRTVNEGYGTVHCAHGDLPVPVPAVLAIADRYHLPMKFTDTEGELVTPTGAAIAAVLWKGRGLPDDFTVEKTGYASGHRKYKTVSILRAMLIRDLKLSADSPVCRLETNIDDCTGEALGFVMDLLLSAGARDVFYTPVFMKKNRPAYMLTVLCSEKDVREMEGIIFLHTTTIGIRRSSVTRDCLPRDIISVETLFGEADIKVCRYEDKTFAYPEYESIRKICTASGLTYQEAYLEIMNAYSSAFPE